jgi:hypothetical protein
MSKSSCAPTCWGRFSGFAEFTEQLHYHLHVHLHNRTMLLREGQEQAHAAMKMNDVEHKRRARKKQNL